MIYNIFNESYNKTNNETNYIDSGIYLDNMLYLLYLLFLLIPLICIKIYDNYIINTLNNNTLNNNIIIDLDN